MTDSDLKSSHSEGIYSGSICDTERKIEGERRGTYDHTVQTILASLIRTRDFMPEVPKPKKQNRDIVIDLCENVGTTVGSPL